MKNLKFSIALIAAFFATNALLAQTSVGVDYYLLGEKSKAKSFFEKEIASNPEEAYFYLGEIAFSEKNFQQAEAFYSKGQSAYNQIGRAKLKLASDTKAAEELLNGIVRKNKGDINVQLAVGRAYLDANMIKQAEKAVAAAKKMDSKNPAVHILEGDVAFSSQVGGVSEKAGAAGGKYEMSNYFDDNYALGYAKFAQIYQSVNPSLAARKLETAIEKRPDYIIAYGMLGRVYARTGFYQKSIDMFEKYFEAGIYSTEDLEMYARSNYFSDNFEKAAEIVNDGLQNNPDHFVLNRYKMYINAKRKLANEGLEDARKFFSLRADTGYISLDYSMYAMILDNAKRYDEAFAQYEKAISMEPESADVFTDAVAAARRKKDYALAAVYLKRQMDKKAQLSGESNFSHDAADISALGYDYYSAGATIVKNEELLKELMGNRQVADMLAANPTVNKALLASDVEYFGKTYSLYHLQKADSIFDILIERLPDSYTGYRFKALVKHAINSDTEAGLAKPYYEKVAELIGEKDDLSASNKRVLLEAYNYLGYYYYVKNDKPNTILYWSKVLDIDPGNENAKLVLDAMKNE